MLHPRLIELRGEMDKIDSQLLALFLRRMEISDEISNVKAENQLPLCDPLREAAVLEKTRASVPPAFCQEASDFMTALFALSKARQLKKSPLLRQYPVDNVGGDRYHRE